MPLKLTENAIRAHLNSALEDVIAYNVTDSTNTRAREFLKEGKKPPFLLVSSAQTAGRGRRGNTFFSPENGFYYTLVIRPDDLDIAIQKMTVAAAVAACEAISETAGIECDIKWVNDLYLDGRKVAGILCEAPRIHSNEVTAIIIGIGINIDIQDFPDELQDKAGSLNRPDLDRSRLAAVLTDRLLAWTSRLDDPQLIREYRRRSFLIKRPVSFMHEGREIRGIVKDINEEGNLIVQADRTYVLSSGEVSLASWE